MFDEPIPDIPFPVIGEYKVLDVDEPLVDLEALGFEILSVYYAKLLPGSTYEAYARKTAAEMLVEASRKLPEGFTFVILDAWRSISVQQALWDEYRKMVVEQNPGDSEEEIDLKTSFFVSKPSYDVMIPSVHNTGGSIDLTIRDSSGHLLDMGTKFDEFQKTANSCHFEAAGMDTRIRDNRRLLYNVMLSAGFTNLPSEWWHYDYGTKFWGYFKGKDPLYRGILER
ncbi:MAG: M15 family metallopeptidase [Eubacteriaceae bacterium]|nr:M15 family metallopeptidase [Eubacteriaceae bacterium]